MIHLHYSNRLEALIEPSAASCTGSASRSARARNDYRAEPRHRGVSQTPAGRPRRRRSELQIPVPARIPREYRRNAHRAADRSRRSRLLDASGLQIAVFEYLRRALDKPKPDLAPVRAYLDATRDEPRSARGQNVSVERARSLVAPRIIRRRAVRCSSNGLAARL